jgi:hypothetical protein
MTNVLFSDNVNCYVHTVQTVGELHVRVESISDQEESKYSEKTLSQCHSVHHKFHMDCHGMKMSRVCAWAMVFNNTLSSQVSRLSQQQTSTSYAQGADSQNSSRIPVAHEKTYRYVTIYIYIYTHTHMYIYIYIYIYRVLKFSDYKRKILCCKDCAFCNEIV